MSQDNQIQDGQAQDRYSQEINEIADILMDISPVDYPRVNERIFRELFMPIFAGEVTVGKGGTTISMWTNYAGNFFTPVSIVDDGGNVLFVVPSIANRDTVRPVDGRTMDGKQIPPMSTVIAAYQQYLGYNPTMAGNYLDAELQARAVIMEIPPSVMRDMQLWNDIFVRYGRKPFLNPEALATDKSKAPPIADDEYEFDLL